MCANFVYFYRDELHKHTKHLAKLVGSPVSADKQQRSPKDGINDWDTESGAGYRGMCVCVCVYVCNCVGCVECVCTWVLRKCVCVLLFLEL